MSFFEASVSLAPPLVRWHLAAGGKRKPSPPFPIPPLSFSFNAFTHPCSLAKW